MKFFRAKDYVIGWCLGSMLHFIGKYSLREVSILEWPEWAWINLMISTVYLMIALLCKLYEWEYSYRGIVDSLLVIASTVVLILVGVMVMVNDPDIVEQLTDTTFNSLDIILWASWLSLLIISFKGED
jgi:uncharacterized membrane protein